MKFEDINIAKQISEKLELIRTFRNRGRNIALSANDDRTGTPESRIFLESGERVAILDLIEDIYKTKLVSLGVEFSPDIEHKGVKG